MALPALFKCLPARTKIVNNVITDPEMHAFRLNALQQHTSTEEDEISNRLAVLQVCFDAFNHRGLIFLMLGGVENCSFVLIE